MGKAYRKMCSENESHIPGTTPYCRNYMSIFTILYLRGFIAMEFITPIQ
jgi:hypothetical protein